MSKLTSPVENTTATGRGHVAKSVCGNMLCGKSEGLKNCSKCKSVAYCSRTCQRVDWNTRHKQTCSAPSGTLTEQDVNEDMSILREVMKQISFDQMTQLAQPDYCIVVQNEGERYSGTVMQLHSTMLMIKANCLVPEERIGEMTDQCSSRQGNFIYVIVIHNRSNVRTYTLKINRQ